MSKTPKKNNPKAKTGKSRRKHGKTRSANVLHAFLLVTILIAISGIVSYALITFHPGFSRSAATADLELDAADTAVTETPAAQPPAPETPPAVTQPVVPPPAITQPTPQRRPARPPAQPPADTPRTPAPEIPPTVTPPVETQPVVPPAAITQRPERPPEQPERRGALVFVIDDAGNNLWELEPFLQLPFPLTIAVLPGLPHSAEAARRIRAAGKEVILHQPMEAIGGQNPGPGAIFSGMSADEIRSILKRNIEEIGPVAGINNHQGSRITMDRQIMETILAFSAEHGLYFLDSRTTSESVVVPTARQMGINVAARDIFIDNQQDRESMLRQIRAGLARAQRNGSAVMIGHTWSPELAALLAEQVPIFTKQGYSIKTASQIINAGR